MTRPDDDGIPSPFSKAFQEAFEQADQKSLLAKVSADMSAAAVLGGEAAFFWVGFLSTRTHIGDNVNYDSARAALREYIQSKVWFNGRNPRPPEA